MLLLKTKLNGVENLEFSIHVRSAKCFEKLIQMECKTLLSGNWSYFKQVLRNFLSVYFEKPISAYFCELYHRTIDYAYNKQGFGSVRHGRKIAILTLSLRHHNLLAYIRHSGVILVLRRRRRK